MITPPVPQGFTRQEVCEFLDELLRLAVLHERANDPTFKGWPDAVVIVEHIKINGLPSATPPEAGPGDKDVDGAPAQGPVCAVCKKPAKHNVPRLGPDGGWIHADGTHLCAITPEMRAAMEQKGAR